MRSGMKTNSDRMRPEIRAPRKLIVKRATGNWNETPGDKFVNEHTWVLEDLVVWRVIERTGDKEYRLVER
jgi:hypothetical protein